ncbi:MAG: bacteriohemerythrin [Bacteroidota bacterium]
MVAIEWHDGLAVGVDFMDADHTDAAAQINNMAASGGTQRIAALEAFIHHCRDHFAREEAMMEKTGFFALHCHRDEHVRVLAELGIVLLRLKGGNAQDDYFAITLPNWLMNHRNTMDYVTAEFARSAGFAG